MARRRFDLLGRYSEEPVHDSAGRRLGRVVDLELVFDGARRPFVTALITAGAEAGCCDRELAPFANLRPGELRIDFSRVIDRGPGVLVSAMRRDGDAGD